MTTPRILITAGPTREFIDEVRYLTNKSSGRMGFALARELAARGALVTVVAGPTEVPAPTGETGISVVPVTTAQEMFDAVAARFADCEVFVAAAAVADYRPVVQHEGKMKKTEGPIRLDLVPNPDILHTMGQRRRANQLLVGFALEVQNAIENAQGKLRRKNCDLIVLNSTDNFGASVGALRIVDATGIAATITGHTKLDTAAKLADFIWSRLPTSPAASGE